jgi:hypothetical protein
MRRWPTDAALFDGMRKLVNRADEVFQGEEDDG